MTEEQAKAFAVLLGDSVATFDEESDCWAVSQTDSGIYRTFEECLEQLADQSDYRLAPYGEEVVT